eukprot:487330_1
MNKKFKSITITSIGNIILMTMHSGEKNQNLFNPEFINEFGQSLDFIESLADAKCLILTGTGRFFSGGLDLKFLNSWNLQLIQKFTNIFKQLLTFNMPTIAAINGHSFGVGMFISMFCDWRLMKKNSGKLCFPEAKMGLNLNIGWRELLQEKLPGVTLRTAILTAKKYNSNEAVTAELIDYEIDANNDNDIFVQECIKFAKPLTKIIKNREKYSTMKKNFYGEIIHGLNIYSKQSSKL